MIIYVYIMNENWDNENIELFLMSNKLVASKQTNVTLSMLISQIVCNKFFSHFSDTPMPFIDDIETILQNCLQLGLDVTVL